MTPDFDSRRELDPELDPAERASLAGIAERLGAAKAVPAPGFRGRLTRFIRRSRPTVRPRHLGAIVAGAFAAGGLLLLVALLVVMGAGPFAY
jgi:hypothetical protein